jgi:bacterioferritin
MSQEALQPPEEATDELSVVEGVIEAESDAVATYRELIEAAEEAGDPVTEDLATELLADEEEHLAEFEGFKAGLLDE